MDAIDVDMWTWSLEVDAATRARLAAHLSPDEVARAERFVNPRHGDAYRVGRGRMREVLAERLGCAPAALTFTYNAQGKPELAYGSSFNLSHSGGLAALVLTEAATRIGVDIEAFRMVEPSVAERFFAPAEVSDLTRLPRDQWQAGFFRCWTRKEAIVKGCGPGLSMPLDSFDVTLAPDAPAVVTRFDQGDPADWTLLHLDIAPDMVGAIAVEAYGVPVRLNTHAI